MKKRYQRLFKDSWRPEDKALESAEEEGLEGNYADEIAKDRAERHRNTPAIRGFEKPEPRPPDPLTDQQAPPTAKDPRSS